MINQLINDAQAENCLILTPNRRISEWLKSKAIFAQKETRKAPHIMPMKNFIQLLWQKSAFLSNNCPFLLSQEQAHFLWKKLMADQHFGHIQHTLIGPLWEAWRILHLYSLDEARIPTDNQDQAIFTHWAAALKKQYQTENLADEFTIIDHFLELGAPLAQALPFKIIHCYAFLDLPPKLLALLETFTAQKIQVDWIEHAQDVSNQISHALAYKTEQDELAAMIDWCIDAYQNTQQVACIVPDINAKRLTLQRKLSEYLPPEAFNISSPLALKQYPLISETLLWLRWQLQPLEKKHARQLLKSHYFKLFTDERGAHIAKLESLKQFQCYYTQFLKRSLYEKQQPLIQWGKQLKQTLYKNLWAHENFSDFEFELAKKLLELLDQMQQVDLHQTAYDLQQTLHLLEALCQQTTYEPNVNHHAPVQVLGQLEGAGLNFDKIWLSSSHDLNWPPPLDPNPFISQSLLTKHEIPNGAPKPTLAFYKKLFDQISHSAQDITFSYSEMIGDLPCQPTSFIQDPFEAAAYTPKQLETIELTKCIDNYGATYSNTVLDGGTYALKVQANCPFQYYTSYRLMADPLEEATPYFDPMLRGQLIHSILEKIWLHFKTQQAIEDLSVLDPVIDQTVTEHMQSLAKQFSQTLIELEHQRIKSLLYDWFEQCELSREPFEVTHIESKGHFEVESMKINFRLDRVDKTQQNETYIIDYKTGQCNIKDWQEAPLIEPQLPLYTLALQADGIYFAKISHKEISFKGLNQSDPEWNNYLVLWKNEIKRLVNEIKAGFAEPKPASSESCQHCAYPALCRITESI